MTFDRQEWARIVAVPGTISNSSQRLPAAIFGRYRAGESVSALAKDYGLPWEQIEWGIRIGFLVEQLADCEERIRLEQARIDRAKGLAEKWRARRIYTYVNELLAALEER